MSRISSSIGRNLRLRFIPYRFEFLIEVSHLPLKFLPPIFILVCWRNIISSATTFLRLINQYWGVFNWLLQGWAIIARPSVIIVIVLTAPRVHEFLEGHADLPRLLELTFLYFLGVCIMLGPWRVLEAWGGSLQLLNDVNSIWVLLLILNLQWLVLLNDCERMILVGIVSRVPASIWSSIIAILTFSFFGRFLGNPF